jgi:hypothetical protein
MQRGEKAVKEILDAVARERGGGGGGRPMPQCNLHLHVCDVGSNVEVRAFVEEFHEIWASIARVGEQRGDVEHFGGDREKRGRVRDFFRGEYARYALADELVATGFREDERVAEK